MQTQHADIAVVGAGIVGIACAYYLARSTQAPKVVVIDPLAPMSPTSAASGENYPNWWPHPVMTAFTDYSIDLMEQISRESDNQLHMTRRGYALATRQADPDRLLRQLHEGYGSGGSRKIRSWPDDRGRGQARRLRRSRRGDGRDQRARRLHAAAVANRHHEIGRASCRERV